MGSGASSVAQLPADLKTAEKVEKKFGKEYDKLNSDFDTLVGGFDGNSDLETQLSNLRTEYANLKEEEMAAAAGSEYAAAAEKKQAAATLAGEEADKQAEGGVVFTEFVKLLEARAERDRLIDAIKKFMLVFDNGRSWYSKNSEYTKADEAFNKVNELKTKLEQLVNWTMQSDSKALQEEIKTSSVGANPVLGPDKTPGSDLKWADWKAKRKVVLELPAKPDPAAHRRALLSSSLHVRLAPPLPREVIG